MTLGVEEEFLIVDDETGELVPRAGELFARAHIRLGDDVARELNLCQIEIGTPVCHDLAGVREHLTRLRRELNGAAASMGSRIAATATHPFGSWRDQTIDPGNERYRRIADVYQVVARQQLIAGCHVHVGIDDRDLAVAVMNRTRRWLPAMVALAANSPFWQGVDTGYSSYRLQIWQRWPTSGMPPWLASAAALDRIIEELIEIDAIEDATFIYWYVRPSARYPTLEFRACDVCLDVDATVAMAGLSRALAWTSMRDLLEGRPEHESRREALDAAMWRGARYGLDATLVSPEQHAPRPAGEVVDELLHHVRDGLDAHGDHAEVTALIEQIRGRGNGASRQRAARAAGGDLRHTIRAIVDLTDPPETVAARAPMASVPPEVAMSTPVLTFALRVELPDEPSSLARVAAVLGGLGANIVDIDVHEHEGRVVDEIVVDVPAATTKDALRVAVVSVGASRVDIEPLLGAAERDLAVRSLDAARRLVETGDPRVVSELALEVVAAEEAALVPITQLELDDGERARLSSGVPVTRQTTSATGERYVAAVPRTGLRPGVVDALVVGRARTPFTATDVHRLRSLMRLHVAQVIANDRALAHLVVSDTG